MDSNERRFFVMELLYVALVLLGIEMVGWLHADLITSDILKAIFLITFLWSEFWNSRDWRAYRKRVQKGSHVPRVDSEKKSRSVP